jgi:phosphatidylglycerophosphatase A
VNRLVVFIAQGFGSGWSPKGPGTVGSVVGVGWFYLLLLPGSWALFFIGLLLGITASIWICGWAEKILKQHDPGSVVLDEIVAVPLAYTGWLLIGAAKSSWRFPNASEFFGVGTIGWLVAGFILFRLFDIWKPWPIRQIQHLRGGWGITADDILAGLWAGIGLALAAAFV